jgi:hypothetical protein
MKFLKTSGRAEFGLLTLTSRLGCLWQIRRMRVALCLILLLAVGANALYEEQAGQIDWYKDQLGAVKFALYPNASSGRLRGTVLVGTQSGVVALLKLKTGSIGRLFASCLFGSWHK